MSLLPSKRCLFLSLLTFFIALLFPVIALAESASLSKDLVEKKKDAVKDLREKTREEVSALRERARLETEAKREDFKKKLAALKDEKKKVLVERIDAKMASINKKRTDGFLAHLDRLSGILTKIESRLAELKVRGVDTTAADTLAAAAAESAVATARESVSSQAAKMYTAKINSESALRADVGQAMKALEADLKATHELVKMAKEATQKAFQALKLLKVKPTSSASSSDESR